MGVTHNESSFRDLSLQITTTSRVFKLQLQRAPSIFHHDVQIITQGQGQDGKQTHGNMDPHTHQVDSHFYHNLDTGSVLSVQEHSDGSYNVAGFLDRNTIIDPPNYGVRKKRATKPQRHIVHSFDNGADSNYRKNNKKNLNSEQILFNSILKNGFDRLSGKDALIQHLIENHRDIDRSDENEDGEEDDDYKEVPSFFDTEDAWKAHQRQAEGNTNIVGEKDDGDYVDEDKITKLTKLLRDTLFGNKKSHKTSKSFYTTRPGSVEEDTPLSRYKRDIQRDNENAEKVNFQSRKVLSLQKEIKLPFYSETTESLLNQMTTLEVPSQIPRPLRNDLLERFLSNQIESWESPSTKQKHSDKMDDGPVVYVADLDNLHSIGSNKVRRKRQVPIEVQPGREMNYGKTTNNAMPQKGKITIEVHAVVDASLYQDFNYNWKTLQLFLLHFWQSVNSRFQALVSPRVQLKIKAISKIMFPGFQPFIENNRVKNSSDWVDVDKVLDDFRSYVQEQFELNSLVPDHDVAFLMTGENLCKRKPDNSWSKKSRGIAYVRGACISARRFQTETYDVGISEVSRSFSGVLTTTHELAHLVGAFHDGEKNALLCPPSSGYIMGEAWNDPVKFNQFSQCSQTNIKDFLENAWYANCLLESVDHKNAATYTFPKELPGQIFSLEEQCYHFIEGVPCKSVPLSSQCGQLCCEKWSQVFKSREPAADGTRCGGGKVCEKGQCIKSI